MGEPPILAIALPAPAGMVVALLATVREAYPEAQVYATDDGLRITER